MTIPDLYQVLDLPRAASSRAVKAAYRAKARQAHPDAGGDPEAFRLLKLARDVLADEDRRRIYDETGEVRSEKIPENDAAQVYVAVGEVLLQVLPQVTSPNYENVLALMRDWAVGHAAELTRLIADLDRTIEKLSQIASRIQIDEGENLLRSIIDGRRDNLRNRREALSRELVLYDKVQDFLDDYRYFTQISNVLISTDVWHLR